MTASQVKIFLQGGFVTIPRKHEDPEVVDNQAGRYHIFPCNQSNLSQLFHRIDKFIKYEGT